MAELNVDVDLSQFEERIEVLSDKMGDQQKTGVKDIANELLRLSQFEVPHDIGTLQNSGVTEPDGEDMIVGYNTPYAAKLHENPQFNFQKGRKGKYLEDPLKMNLRVFNNIMGGNIEVAIQ